MSDERDLRAALAAWRREVPAVGAPEPASAAEASPSPSSAEVGRAIARALDAVEAALSAEAPLVVALAGEPGVGRRTLAAALARDGVGGADVRWLVVPPLDVEGPPEPWLGEVQAVWWLTDAGQVMSQGQRDWLAERSELVPGWLLGVTQVDRALANAAESGLGDARAQLDEALTLAERRFARALGLEASRCPALPLAAGAPDAGADVADWRAVRARLEAALAEGAPRWRRQARARRIAAAVAALRTAWPAFERARWGELPAARENEPAAVPVAEAAAWRAAEREWRLTMAKLSAKWRMLLLQTVDRQALHEVLETLGRDGPGVLARHTRRALGAAAAASGAAATGTAAPVGGAALGRLALELEAVLRTFATDLRRIGLGAPEGSSSGLAGWFSSLAGAIGGALLPLSTLQDGWTEQLERAFAALDRASAEAWARGWEGVVAEQAWRSREADAQDPRAQASARERARLLAALDVLQAACQAPAEPDPAP